MESQVNSGEPDEQPLHQVNLRQINKKVNRKVQGVPQSQGAANPRLQEEEEKDKIDTCKTNKQMNKKNIHQGPGLQSIFIVRYLKTDILA